MASPTKPASHAAALLREAAGRLGEGIVSEIYRRDPTWEKYGEDGRHKSVRDAAAHINYLAEALELGDAALFLDYIEWFSSLFSSLGFSRAKLAETLRVTLDVLARELPPDALAPASHILEEAAHRCSRPAAATASHLREDAALGTLARQYTAALLSRDRQKARQLILSAVESGTDVRDIYLEVFQPSQYEIGRLWETNRISVAEEHYCTAATQLIMSQLYPRIFSSRKNGLKLVSACVGGELHEIGARMVTDFFEMEGWDTYFYGASTPPEAVLDAVTQIQPHVLGLSATISLRVSDVARLIRRVRESFLGRSVKILVGGHPFNQSPGLWKTVGADGFSRDARGAVATAVSAVTGT